MREKNEKEGHERTVGEAGSPIPVSEMREGTGTPHKNLYVPGTVANEFMDEQYVQHVIK
jgi:hypothetical protein